MTQAVVERDETLTSRILVVDDHPMVRAGLASAVKAVSPDADVVECDRLETALERLAAEDYRLVLLDLMLPDASPDVLRTVAGAAGDAPVLVVSMLDDPKWVRQTLADGAAGFLPKSSSPSVTRHALTLVMEGETYVPPQALSEETGGGSAGGAAGAWSAPDPDAWRRFGLSPMQRRVLIELGKGVSNQQISEDLGIALSTVKAHVGAVIHKLGARNRTHAVLIAREAGLL
ncbi:MAG: response regulator transcription factor [Marivibrio sp.]|uniref:response regulator transcription factor n=1 Tax=Marivibrio sp. TaxID=2039719 RepID=UPI0032EB01EF